MIAGLPRRSSRHAFFGVLALLLAGCQDMSARDYYIFGRPSSSQPPATQAPQPVSRPPESGVVVTQPPIVMTPAPDLPPARTPETVPAAPVEQRPVVALLLPLSGPSAAIGRALSDAATLALFDIGDENFVLLPRDTGGTPEGAAIAAREAIETGARLIVGPLFAAEVPSVASVAGPAGINVISLSNDRAIAGPGIYVFGLSPQGQIERILSFARTRGLQRYAALLPSNAYGAAIEDATRRTAALVSARMSIVERYDPAAGDATPVVRRLASYEARRAAVLAQRRELEGRDDELSRVTLQRLDSADGGSEGGFDSVLLPDFGDRLLSIAPLLPYYDIDPARVRFLGTAFWEDARLTREPALIGGWFPAPPPEARAEFQRRYRQIYGVDPPRIATLAYDSVALAAVLARTEGGPDFSAAAIGNPNGFSGVDGIFRFRTDGTVERGLAVLEVRRDGFRTISPAPNDFRAVTR